MVHKVRGDRRDSPLCCLHLRRTRLLWRVPLLSTLKVCPFLLRSEFTLIFSLIVSSMRPITSSPSSAVGIHSLPPELLLLIFQEVPKPGPKLRCCPPEDLDSPTRWLPLRLVCRQWHGLVDNHCQDFWRVIDITRKSEWVDACLNNSQQAGLELRFHRGISVEELPPGFSYSR